MIGIDQMQHCSRLDLVYNHKFLILRAKHCCYPMLRFCKYLRLMIVGMENSTGSM